MSRRLIHLIAACTLLASSPISILAGQSQLSARRTDDDARATAKAASKPQEQSSEAAKPPTASDAAANLRRILPTVPPVSRGQDGLLNPFGQRATQNQLVTGTNVKDPVTDAFVFASALPLEAAEPVVIPSEQFAVSLSKFYTTVPLLDPISKTEWHFSLGSPLFSLRHLDGVKGVRSAAPVASLTGPIGKRLSLFQSVGYRLSRTTIPNIEGESHDSDYESLDSSTHFDINAGRGHSVAARFALFSQDIDFATLSALTLPEASPDFAMGAGHLSFSDSLASPRGFVLDSSASFRKVRLRILPHGSGPMLFIEQGELEDNYFDTLRRSSSRFEWKESVQFPGFKAWGDHQLSFGGGFARSAFESTHIGGEIILRGEEEDELTAIFNFTGSPFESLSMREGTLWIEDRWAPSPRVSFTLGQRYDRTTVSRTNEWAPRLGFAFLPFSERTVIRGGAGVFYDIMPLNAGTFTRSRQRVVEFFDDGVPISEVRTLTNLATRPNLRTPHVLGWNIEVNHELTKTLYVRVKGEERRGRNLLLVSPDLPGSAVTALVLSDTGRSRFRELEATAGFRPAAWGNVNASYIRSSSLTDTNTFTSSVGTFEKLVTTPNRFARSRADAPHRFLVWGDVRTPGSVMVSPGLDVHTGFPFAFVDADANVAPLPDFGRFPRFVSFDLGLYRDFGVKTFDHSAKLRLGFKVFNLTNHFNPRDAINGENHEEDLPVFRGFANGAGRSYRATMVWSF